ncbi:hypothetical protein C8A00DRAFT_17860 [Chaetomidium leptoderma]|uniref:Uncharacterized protein n=1 Tax=Chaetomidium leptoderma TaxID=669021 RepID=A0AAN6VFQ3_9PEZI|nr:hypothetical protein C8A00DRAFT_17860 [Chaetomidium leptoderma]
MAAAMLNLVACLYQATARQQVVVNDQEDNVRFLQETNDLLIDVEQHTSVNMKEEIGRSLAARGVLEDLHDRLTRAIDQWCQLRASDTDQEESPKSPSPGPQSPGPPVEEQSSPTSGHNNRALDFADAAASSHARYEQQWKNWAQAPSINYPSTLNLSQPTPWWMQDKDQYGLCQPSEQRWLEDSARAAQLNRAYIPASSPPPAPARHQSFATLVSVSRYHHAHQPALPPPIVPEVELSHSRRARANSDDFWLDEDYDPNFWQNNLRPGNIWTDLPCDPIFEEDTVSPRTVPPSTRY